MCSEKKNKKRLHLKLHMIEHDRFSLSNWNFDVSFPIKDYFLMFGKQIDLSEAGICKALPQYMHRAIFS